MPPQRLAGRRGGRRRVDRGEPLAPLGRRADRARRGGASPPPGSCRPDRDGRVLLVGAALIAGPARDGRRRRRRDPRGPGGPRAVDVRGRGRPEPPATATDGDARGPIGAGRSSIRVAATLPRLSRRSSPGDVVTVDGPIRPRPRLAVRRLPRADRGRRHAHARRSIEVAPRPADAGHVVEDARRAAGDGPRRRVLPEPEAGLAAGILIGLRDRVDRDLAAAFTTAGVSHVVAISGWNIAIVAAAVAAFAGRLGRRRRSVVTMVAIVAYVVFAGASASVVRAGADGRRSCCWPARSGRAGRAAAALGWAAACSWSSDPGLVGDAGFQLSAWRPPG